MTNSLVIHDRSTYERHFQPLKEHLESLGQVVTLVDTPADSTNTSRTDPGYWAWSVTPLGWYFSADGTNFYPLTLDDWFANPDVGAAPMDANGQPLDNDSIVGYLSHLLSDPLIAKGL